MSVTNLCSVFLLLLFFFWLMRFVVPSVEVIRDKMLLKCLTKFGGTLKLLAIKCIYPKLLILFIFLICSPYIEAVNNKL